VPPWQTCYALVNVQVMGCPAAPLPQHGDWARPRQRATLTASQGSFHRREGTTPCLVQPPLPPPPLPLPPPTQWAPNSSCSGRASAGSDHGGPTIGCRPSSAVVSEAGPGRACSRQHRRTHPRGCRVRPRLDRAPKDTRTSWLRLSILRSTSLQLGSVMGVNKYL
jgi:hypothetical protein